MNNNKIHISIIIPVYGCCKSLNELYSRLKETISKITEEFEIIMINDASPDDSWKVIQELSKKDSRVKGINLSRNFGQHYAITAGLDYVTGDWNIVMDCDLQDQPEEIIKLYNKSKEGYDIVVGRRAERKDKFFKKLFSKLFYKVFYYFTDTSVNNRIGNFGIYSRKVISSIKKLKEQNRSFGLFAIWVGFSRIEIDIIHSKRIYGETAYTFDKLINLAIDSIIAHSNKPLKLSVKLGFLLSLFSMAYGLFLISKYLFFSTPIEGWTSLMVSIYFLSGLILGSIGMSGLYIGKIFDEVKKRPLYIVESTTFNVDKENNL